jgi:cytochrome c oxidase subunit 1
VIPTGIQFFCWAATLWSARKIVMTTATYFTFGFFFIFMAGGLTGVMLASVPVDTQVHDSYFVVAHFHYVLIGGMVFPLMAAFYHWLPKMTGRLLSETAGKINFWLVFIGFNLTFFPMHVLGMHGMPRRVYTYPAETGWGWINTLVSIGAVFLVAGGLVFIGNFLWARRGGAPAGNDPWGADTLEWLTSSPPPNYNFANIPVVTGRYPLWSREPEMSVVTGLKDDRRQVLVTGVLSAEPDHRYTLPESSIWPLALALATSTAFIASVFIFRYIVIGIVLGFIAAAGWFWPNRDPRHAHLEEREQ